MVVLQCALEGIWRDGVAVAILLLVAAASSEFHQVITLVITLLSSPDSPCHNGQSAQDDSSADADNNTNDRSLGLGGHTTGG